MSDRFKVFACGLVPLLALLCFQGCGKCGCCDGDCKGKCCDNRQSTESLVVDSEIRSMFHGEQSNQSMADNGI